MNKKIVYGAIAIAFIVAVLALFGLSHRSSSPLFGSPSTTITTSLPSLGVFRLAVGPNCGGNSASGCTGTVVNRLNMGFCYIQAYSATISASTTAQVDCQGQAAVAGLLTATDTPLTGVSYGDSVVAELSTSTASGGASAGASPVFNGLDLLGSSASTTNGYITLLLFNATGKTYTWPTTGTATGTASYVDNL